MISPNIPIPLNGIDPDGDSVELVEPASAAKRGTIDEVAVDHLVYRAYDDAAGLDTFTYRVRDALGAEAIGTIRVGVAPAESANQAPYAVTDSLHVRPGRIVAVPVLANDSDPEGKQLLVVPDGLVVPDVDGLEAETLPGLVEITAPGREMETSVQYTIEDEHGARTQGVNQVTVDDEEPLQAPVAKDAHVLPADIQDDFTADVDLRERLSNPDGTPSTLELTAEQLGRHRRLAMRSELHAVLMHETLHPREVVTDLVLIEHCRRQAQVFVQQIPSQSGRRGRGERDFHRPQTLVESIDHAVLIVCIIH